MKNGDDDNDDDNTDDDDDKTSPNSANHLLYGLRDYSDQNVVIDNMCPLTSILDKDGQKKVVRKSSILWALTNDRSKLSKDRLQRVRGGVLESANKRTLSKTHNAETQKQETTFEEMISMEQNIHLGDCCVFSKDGSSTSIDNLLVGRVLAFR